ncbi:MATE family efflux transporter [Candidatus Dependentiae bacterium]|nr:MATE family efflux transporter [Candidatus Dependentiae bacterium]
MRKELSIKNILRLTWPAIISYSTIIFIGIIDLLFIRKTGTIAIAIVATANSFITGLYQFMEGIKSGTTVLTAKYFGAENKLKISKILNFALFLALIIGTIIAILAPILSHAAYYLIGGEKLNHYIYFRYLTIRLYAAPLVLIFYAISGFFNGLKKTYIPLILTNIILISNIILNYVLSSLFAITNNYTHTIAQATLYSYIIGIVFSLLFLFKNKLSKTYLNIKAGFKNITYEYNRISFEISIYTGILSLALLLFILIFSKLGPQALAIHQLTFQIFMVAYLIPGGFLVSSSILIGKLFGEKRNNLIIYATTKIIAISIIIMSILCLILFIFSEPIANFFSPNNLYVARLTAQSIQIVCAERIFGTIYMVLRGALIGVEDTKFVAIAGGFTSYFVFLPLTYIIGFKMNVGVIGGYLAFLIWSMIDCSVFSFRFFVMQRWKSKT